MRNRARGAIALVPAALVLLLLGTAAFDFVVSASQVVRFPYPVDYGEAAMLNQTILLARLESVYSTDLTTPPYIIWNFPALFSLVQVPAFALFGPALWYGRLLSVLSIVVAAGALGCTLLALTRDRLAAAIGGLSLLAIPMVSFWASLNRVDSLALGLSWSALALIVRRPLQRYTIVASGILLTAAIYTRQSYGLAAPMAAVAWLLAAHGYREAGRLLLVLGGTSLVLLLMLQWATDGGFALHIIFSNINEYEVEIVRGLFGFLLALMPLFFVAGALFVVWRPGRTQAWHLGAAYLLGATVSALTVGKVGSNVNYFFELFAGLCFALGAFLAARQGAGRAALLVLVAAQLALLLLWESPQDAEVHQRIAARAELEALHAMIEQADGPVLADEYLAMLPLAGKGVYLQPFIFTQLAKLESWDQQPILSDIQARMFGLIVMRHVLDNPMTAEWWTDEMRASIDRYYEVSDTIPELDVQIYRAKTAL